MTPVKNVAASVHQRLLNLARASGRPVNELAQNYALERWLYRLARSEHKKASARRNLRPPLPRPSNAGARRSRLIRSASAKRLPPALPRPCNGRHSSGAGPSLIPCLPLLRLSEPSRSSCGRCAPPYSPGEWEFRSGSPADLGRREPETSSLSSRLGHFARGQETLQISGRLQVKTAQELTRGHPHSTPGLPRGAAVHQAQML